MGPQKWKLCTETNTQRDVCEKKQKLVSAETDRVEIFQADVNEGPKLLSYTFY